ncbi:MAG TPA: PAS domain S-box protein, partial [Anaerovoracaceae bacterium]|nr:PAS domain S-box protein [Anaerovoracaceae bacterium]
MGNNKEGKNKSRIVVNLKRAKRNVVYTVKKFMISKKDNSNPLKQSMFIALSVFGILGCGPLLIGGSKIFMEEGLNNIALIEIGSWMLLVFVAFFKLITIEIRSLIILIILYSFSVILLLTAGNSGAGFVCILAFMFLSGLVLDRRKLLIFLAINVILFVLITYLLLKGNLDGLAIANYKSTWYINMLVTQISGMGLMFLVNILYNVIKRSNYQLVISNELLEKSREKEKVYADIYRSAPIAIGVGLPNGDVVDGNEQFETLIGYSKAEMNEFKWNKRSNSKKLVEKEKKLLSRLSPKNNVVKYENEIITKEGYVVPLELTVKAIFKEDESLDYYISFAQNISERKETEKQLNELNFELENLVEERTKELKSTSNSLKLATKAGKIGVWEWVEETNE